MNAAPPIKWTRQNVLGRLEEAGSVLRRLAVRGCWPAEYRSNWPDYPREGWWDGISDIEIVRDNTGAIFTIRPAKTKEPKPGPTPAEITRLDEFMVWVEMIGDGHEIARLLSFHHHSDKTAERTVLNRRFVLWCMAFGWSLRKTGAKMNLSHERVRQIVGEALDRLIERLNETGLTNGQDC